MLNKVGLTLDHLDFGIEMFFVKEGRKQKTNKKIKFKRGTVESIITEKGIRKEVIVVPAIKSRLPKLLPIRR